MSRTKIINVGETSKLMSRSTALIRTPAHNSMKKLILQK